MTPQLYAAIAAASVVLCVLAGVAYAFFASPRPPEETLATSKVLRRRGFFVFAPFLVAVIIVLTWWNPYGAQDHHMATADGDGIVHVYVTAHQWSWELADKDGHPITEIPAGTVVFYVRSADGDVSHAFDIYDPQRPLWKGTLEKQTQAVPGYTNALKMTLKPGTYIILCTTYCDGGHAHMQETLTVVART